jgi:hypothetical protein
MPLAAPARSLANAANAWHLRGFRSPDLSPVVWHPDPALWESTFIATKLRIERARARLDVLLALDTDWDPDGAAPPNRRAGAIVSNILDELEKEALILRFLIQRKLPPFWTRRKTNHPL